MVLEFPIMADYALLEADGVVLYATHGHLWNEMYLPPMREGTVLLNGHTHVPACTPHGSYVYMNPGSVSIPAQLYDLGKRGIPVERFGRHGISGVPRAADRPLAALERPREEGKTLY